MNIPKKIIKLKNKIEKLKRFKKWTDNKINNLKAAIIALEVYNGKQ